MLKLDPEAWKAGFAAGREAGKASCPYPAKSTEALSWHSGFIEGRGAVTGARTTQPESKSEAPGKH